MKPTKQTLRHHFGVMWEYDHAVNLLERQSCNSNHMQASLDWAELQIREIKCLIPMLKVNEVEGEIEHFEETLRILEYLTTTK